jgi:hypothetical protein
VPEWDPAVPDPAAVKPSRRWLKAARATKVDPAVDTPPTDTPTADSPTADSPAAVTPAETPIADSPAAVTPAETPIADSPTAVTPAETPTADSPAAVTETVAVEAPATTDSPSPAESSGNTEAPGKTDAAAKTEVLDKTEILDKTEVLGKTETTGNTEAGDKADAPTLVTTVSTDSPKHAAPPAARTNKALAVTFAILAALFLAGTGVMTALYVNQTDAYAKEAKLASQRSEQVAAAQAELVQVKAQLATAGTTNTNLQTQLTTAQSQIVQIQAEKATVSKCLDDLHKFFIAEDANASDATLTSLYNTAQLSCDEANKFLQ